MEKGKKCIIVSPDYTYSLEVLKEKFEFNNIIGPYIYKDYDSPRRGDVNLCSAEMNDPTGRSYECGEAAPIYFILYYDSKSTEQVNDIANCFVASSRDAFGRKKDVCGNVLFETYGKECTKEDFRVFGNLVSEKLKNNKNKLY